MPPEENLKFCKFDLLSLNLVVILIEKIHEVTLFIISLQFVSTVKRHSQQLHKITVSWFKLH